MIRLMMSAPGRRRAVLVVLVLVALGGALTYGLAAPGPGFVALLVSAGAVLAAWGLASTDHARPPSSTRPASSTDEPGGPVPLDGVPDTAAALDAPGGTAAGFWDGLAAYGPGYAHGVVFVRTDPAGWEHGLWPAPGCPDCGSGDGLSLVWLEDRPDLARLWCSCGTTWTHPAWCTDMGTAWALDTDEGHEGGHERDGADVDPRLSHLAEMIRRQAGNTPRRGGGGDPDDIW